MHTNIYNKIQQIYLKTNKISFVQTYRITVRVELFELKIDLDSTLIKNLNIKILRI